MAVDVSTTVNSCCNRTIRPSDTPGGRRLRAALGASCAGNRPLDLGTTFQLAGENYYRLTNDTVFAAINSTTDNVSQLYTRHIPWYHRKPLRARIEDDLQHGRLLEQAQHCKHIMRPCRYKWVVWDLHVCLPHRSSSCRLPSPVPWQVHSLRARVVISVQES